MTSGKTIALSIWIFVDKVMLLLYNMLSRFVKPFLARSKDLLISWLQSLSTVVLEPKKIKSVIVSIFFLIYLLWSDGTQWHDLSFCNMSFKPVFSLFSLTFIKKVFSFSLPSALGWYHLHIWGYFYFSGQYWFQLVFSSSPAFGMIYSTYKLNKQGDTI